MTESEQKVAEMLGYPAMTIRFIQATYPKLWDALVAAQSQHAERWIAVTEKLPEHDGKYLCWHADEIPVISYFAAQSFYNDGEAQDVTHWRPLPAAPERST